VLRDGTVLYWWVELLLVGVFYAVYSTIRNTNEGGTAAARRNARHLIGWQKTLGIYHEETLQRWALHFKPLVVAANYFYGSLHFFVTGGVMIYLFHRWSDDYPVWRNTLAITTGIALIGFMFWPLMPPRLMPASYGFVDTLAKYPTFWSFNSGAVNKISNQCAAMPSVHCAWALWCACALVPRVKHVWAKALAVLYPVCTVTAIVLTGNHYFLDAVGGFIVLGIGYLLAHAFTRAGRSRAPQPLTT
jgi:PAP2 superfamily protein